MKTFVIVALVGYLGCICAAPIELCCYTTGPTRPSIKNPTCTNDLCRRMDEHGNTVDLLDGNYKYPSYEADYIDRCFYTCSGGQATCQCCNDDSKGAIFYNEHCDRCVFEADRNLTDCPTTKPWGPSQDPCTLLEDQNYPNFFCRNLRKILGADYDNLDGDYAYTIVSEEDYAKRPLTAKEFLALPKVPNAYISCVAGTYGWCRPCASWDLLHWVTKIGENGEPVLQCGQCDWNIVG